MIPAPMDTTTGKCTACREYARDCDCHLCPDCEEIIRGHFEDCAACGYECD